MKRFAPLFLALLLTISCSKNDLVVDLPADRYQLNTNELLKKVETSDVSDEREIDVLLNGKILSLSEVLKITKILNSELKAASSRIKVEMGNAIQAGTIQNPELELEWEELSLNGDFAENSAIKVMISQEISLSGRYRVAKKAALAKVAKAYSEYDETCWNVYQSVIERYLNLDIAVRKTVVAKENLSLAVNFVNLTEKLSKAGSVPKFYLNRAKVDLARAEMVYEESQRNLEKEKILLIASIGLESEVKLEFETLKLERSETPELSELHMQMRKNNPSLLSIAEEVICAETAKEAAEAESCADITISGGYTAENSGDQKLSIGLGLPLPIFDRNQGEIQAATAEIEAVKAEYDKMEIELSGLLNSAFNEMQTKKVKFEKYETEIIPSMKEILKIAELGFAKGEFSALEVLEAKKSLLDASAERLEALNEFWFSLIEIQFLTANPKIFNPFGVK